MTQVKLVENGLQAKKEIEQFLNQGFTKMRSTYWPTAKNVQKICLRHWIPMKSG